MFNESQWKEIRSRENDFRKLYSGEGCDYLLSWYLNVDLDQMRADYLFVDKDREKWLQNELRAVKENVIEALDTSSLFYPIAPFQLLLSIPRNFPHQASEAEKQDNQQPLTRIDPHKNLPPPRKVCPESEYHKN